MRARRLIAIGALLVLGACSSSSTTSADGTTTAPPRAQAAARPVTNSAGCRAAAPVRPGSTRAAIMSGGVARTYELDVPASYTGKTPFALVLGLHPLSVSYTFMPSEVGFTTMAKRFAFIGVAPSGLLDGPTPYWDAAPTADNYDVAFLTRLLDDLEARLCIDPTRVFSTGISNGAQMSSLLACRLPDRIAGIGTVSGIEYLTPCNGRPVPVIAFHGTADPYVPYKGGGLSATRIAAIDFYHGKLPAGLPTPVGVEESMRRWAAHNRCRPTPVDTQVTPHVRRRTWQGCAAPTILYTVQGGGHQWPGKPMPAFDKTFGPGTAEVDASDLMFKLFFTGTS